MPVARWRLAEDAARRFVHLAEQAGLDAGLAADAARDARFVAALTSPARPWHGPILAMARRRPIEGITLGDTVYLARAEGLGDWPLVVHELTHVLQFRRAGVPAFLLQYSAGWARRRVAGLDAWRAYHDLPDEIEARDLEARARALPRPSARPLEPG